MDKISLKIHHFLLFCFALLFSTLISSEEGIDDIEKEKQLIRLYGTAGYTYYAHIRFKNELLEYIRKKGDVIDEERTTILKPKDLVGKYPDITHCDISKIEFKMSDKDGYISYYALSEKELKLWREIQSEKKP